MSLLGWEMAQDTAAVTISMETALISKNLALLAPEVDDSVGPSGQRPAGRRAMAKLSWHCGASKKASKALEIGAVWRQKAIDREIEKAMKRLTIRGNHLRQFWLRQQVCAFLSRSCCWRSLTAAWPCNGLQMALVSNP